MVDAQDRWIRSSTGTRGIERRQRVQSLWSGYGEVQRLTLTGGDTVILKQVAPPAGSGRGHARKLRSYAVEQAFYRDFAPRCATACRVPACLGLRAEGHRWWFLLEDLDAAGFPGRRHGLSATERDQCLAWLAAFHATFLGEAPSGLWPTGTYWHLATRPDERQAMPRGPLRDAAQALDARLSAATHQTLVHGDAKPANFCFGSAGVAAVDFQYVGGGVGVKDLAYLLGAFGSRELGRRGDHHVDRYFALLGEALVARGKGAVASEVEGEWRPLFAVAWADFERFLAGWAPGSGSRDGWSRALIREALEDR